MQSGADKSGTIAILERLVAFPTICGTSNADLIDWVEQYLVATGARVERVPGDAEGRSSLFATIGPDGPDGPDGIILSAHSDVVPVAGQDWTTDPFRLTARDGRLYGRGSSDMKGFLACMLTAAASAGRRTLRRPLHLAISHDEELGCLGVRSLLRALGQQGVTATGCVVGEPTEMGVAVAHKGKIALKITCHGRAAHSANPFRGQNAIVLASEMVIAAGRMQDHIRQVETHDGRFEVPFSTVQIGLIDGGTALNIVPDRCVIMAEIRLLPGYDGADYVAWLHDAARRITDDGARGGITVEIVNAYPGLASSGDGGILATGLRHARQNKTGVIDFGTEAGLFESELGIPCIVCGPGSISRAHKADEYILPAELAEGDRFLAGILDDLCAEPGA